MANGVGLGSGVCESCAAVPTHGLGRGANGMRETGRGSIMLLVGKVASGRSQRCAAT